MADLPEKLKTKWKILRHECLAQTASAVVFRVRTASRQTQIVKSYQGEAGESERAAAWLRWQNGRASVRLLDKDGDFLLMEDAGDTSLLTMIKGKDDRAALEIAAELTHQLHEKTTGFPKELKPLGVLFAALLSALKADKLSDSLLYREAARLLPEAALDDEQRPLHGDLHFENIMKASRGWLAIDPHGYLGHRAFDYANYFYNPRLRPEITDNPNRIFGMAELFSKVSGISEKTLLRMAFLYGCLSASWFVEDGDRQAEKATLVTAQQVYHCLSGH